MRRNHFFISCVAAAMLLFGGLSASAQTGALAGEVIMKQADGTTVPVAGAQIDVYRTDVGGKYNTKTDKKGKFVFAGLPYTGTYLIAASAENARPDVLGDVKAGREGVYRLVLTPGDGKHLTEAEAKSMVSNSAAPATAGGGGGGGESKEDRAKREELLRKNAEIEAGNKKIEEANTTVTGSFKAGNEALNAKNYDLAITQYTAGINADPTHPGAPSLLTNRSVAYRARGVDRYNAAVTSKDDAAKSSGMTAAQQDFRDAADSAAKAVELYKTQPAPTDPAALKNYETNKYFALAARAEAMRLLVTKADPTQADAGLTAYQEYMAAETNPEKKAKAQVDVAQMLLDAGSSDKAYAEFQKVLAENPDNVDALLGAGLALFSSQDKTKFQEAANFLQRFVDKAPDTHKFKADAKAVLDNLKSQENIKPQKTTTTTGGRRRG
ncbi:MAG TPA: carboxypeptidase regulatory-like domain-containing protein [Pyrinomonadaceae bacterium]|jgi:tetratricopeptide (TPR) repeat protein